MTVFADGEVDRSPCGSGTCSRIATLAAQGRLQKQQTLIHHSIVGSTFYGRILQHVTADGRDAIIPAVTGTAYQTGQHTFLVDPDDDMTPPVSCFASPARGYLTRSALNYGHRPEIPA